MVERLARGAMNLRHATQRIGILDERAIFMALHELAVHKKGTQIGCGFSLSLMRPDVLYLFGKSLSRSKLSFQRHGANDIRNLGQLLGFEQCQCADGRHDLRAIDQSQSFLGTEYDTSQAGMLERRST